ncbi:uncharacterized protein METZ01_LOCUS144723, partial [marine metagenome]
MVSRAKVPSTRYPLLVRSARRNST